jgi:ADP-dependent NAD(P)H-hydrate dehydratase
MDVVATDAPFKQPVLMTPHAGEMAHLTQQAKAQVQAAARSAARDAAQRWNAVVTLKGAQTHIAVPEGRCWLHEGGNASLASSGSGDVLAGLMAGLVARGATLAQSAAWGVVVHAMAGARLTARQGSLGSLARELPAEIPPVLRDLSQASPARR